MRVFRICSHKYENDITGEGARRQTANRWNSRGTPVLYTADSAALCAVELSKLVHPGFAPKNYRLLEIEIPDITPLEVESKYFETDWINNILSSQIIGDHFIKENRFLILKVPSAWVYSCFNYLINPNHPNFSDVKILRISDFEFRGKLFEGE